MLYTLALEKIASPDWEGRLSIYKNITTDFMLLCEFVSFIVGLIFFKKYKGTPVVLFIIFLGYNMLNEHVASLYYILGNDNNHIFYNIRSGIYFPLMLTFYWLFLKTNKFKKATLILGCVWLIIYLSALLLGNFEYSFDLLTSSLGDFILMLIILFNLIEIINSSNLSNVTDNIVVYVSLGFLIYFVADLPISVIIYTGWLREATEEEVKFFILFRQISMVIGSFMYLIFAYGLWKSKRPDVKLK